MRNARRTQTELDLAGKRIEDTSIAAQEYYVPSRVEIIGDRLTWDTSGASWRAQRPQSGLLDGFLTLSDASPDRIETYAARHGVLGLCQHGFPGPHQRSGVYSPGESVNQSCRRPGHEPLPRWRELAAQANALLRIAADLPTSDDPQAQRTELAALLRHKEDWKVLGHRVPKVPRSRSVQPARPSAMVAGIISQWLAWGGVRPVVAWPAARPRMELWLGSFFGALALDLAFAVTGTRGVAFCAECGRPFIPGRRIAATDKRAHFCDACRSAGVPQRRASQRFYQRRTRSKRGGAS